MTEQALEVKENKDLVLTEEIVREYICKDASKKEIFLFLNIARAYNLNPFKREIYLVKYQGKPAQNVVGYETYLKRAEGTDKLDGWKVWIESGDGGKKAKIIIHRKDRSKPFEWEVDDEEFNKKQAMWKVMPNHMLKKVATAIGFRLCFPEELGGMPYIPEEMGVENGDVVPPEKEPPKRNREPVEMKTQDEEDEL
jgi:phage recombination protein Bet